MKFKVGLRFLGDNWSSFEATRDDLQRALDVVCRLAEEERVGGMEFVRAEIGVGHITDEGHRGIEFCLTIESRKEETNDG